MIAAAESAPKNGAGRRTRRSAGATISRWPDPFSPAP